MKYYENSTSSKSYFITSYEIDNDSIIVYYADKKTEILKYDKETEKQLLKKMKRQVLQSYNDKKEYRNKMLLYLFWNVNTLYWTFYSINSLMSKKEFEALLLICGIMQFICFGYFNNRLIFSITSYKDLEKNKLFIDNEELLNKEYNNYINSISNAKIKNEIPDNIVKYDINNIDKVKYKNLKKMIKRAKNKNF